MKWRIAKKIVWHPLDLERWSRQQTAQAEARYRKRRRRFERKVWRALDSQHGFDMLGRAFRPPT